MRGAPCSVDTLLGVCKSMHCYYCRWPERMKPVYYRQEVTHIGWRNERKRNRNEVTQRTRKRDQSTRNEVMKDTTTSTVPVHNLLTYTNTAERAPVFKLQTLQSNFRHRHTTHQRLRPTNPRIPMRETFPRPRASLPRRPHANSRVVQHSPS